MTTIREVKGHIQSIRSISQVTNAMQVVSTAKLHRLQGRAESTRAFAERSWEVLNHLASVAASEVRDNPMFSGYPTVGRLGLLVITGNTGMVGAYNHTVIAATLHYLQALQDQTEDVAVEAITIGREGRAALLRAGYHIHADFSAIDDKADITSITPVARVILDGYRERTFERVMMAHTQSRRGAQLSPVIRQLLPFSALESGETREYIYEPSAQELLLSLVPRIIRFQAYQAFLESLVAENMSRMAAMRAATQNAEHLVGQLTLSYNKARQQAITSELVDLLGATAGLEEQSTISLPVER